MYLYDRKRERERELCQNRDRCYFPFSLQEVGRKRTTGFCFFLSEMRRFDVGVRKNTHNGVTDG